MAGSRSSALARFLLLLFRVVFTFFAIGTTVFIFSNSLEIGSASSLRSQEVTALLNRYLSPVGLSLTEAVVRKLAHFAEYALLAFWFTLCLRVYTRHYIRHISWPLFLVLLVANMDETLQTYVANRNGSVRDVWIDFGGGMTGVLAALVIIMLLGGFWRLLGFGRHREQ
ncbi:MAG: VanZ family protein [Clostridiales bacterium]|nr:VanZ family protein [Clostridiales bacterium]